MARVTSAMSISVVINCQLSAICLENAINRGEI